MIQFLDALHGEATRRGLFACVFSLPSRNVKAFKDLGEAAQYIESIKEKEDVYIGVCPLSQAPEAGKRGDSSLIGGLTCFWLDLDYGSHHKKPGIPATKEDAMRILVKIGKPPSLLINSGNGLHAYWFLTDPLWFKNDDDRKFAADLAKNWVSTCQACAGSLNFKLDSVGDLPRVLRIPGTYNHKGEKRKEVGTERVETPMTMYSRDELSGLIMPPEFMPEKRAKTARVTRDIDPVLPQEPDENTKLKVDALVANDKQFNETWMRVRTDLQDQSPSGYDLSMANKLVAAGMSDQEIATILLMWRRMHHEDEKKLFRRDYLMRTIDRAREGVESVSALESIRTEVGVVERGEVTEDERDKILGILSKGFGVQIVGLIKHGKEESDYSMEISDGRTIRIGAVENLASQRKMRLCVADATGVFLKMVKPDPWHFACECMLTIAEEIDSEEYTTLGRMTMWLRDYVESGRVITRINDQTKDQLADIFQEGEAFWEEGKLWLSIGKFIEFVSVSKRLNNLTAKGMCEDFRMIGWKGKKRSVRIKGKKDPITRNYWCGKFKHENNEATNE